MSGHEGYQWAQKNPGEWWYAQVVDGEPWMGPRNGDGVSYPPMYSVSFTEINKGRVRDISCLHFYDYSNGASPDDKPLNLDDVDYLHLCGDDGVRALLDALNALLEALPAEVEA